MAFASQRAEDIRAEGEAQAAEYLQETKDEELAIFLAWLDAVETALSKNTTLILDSELRLYLLEVNNTNSNDIPQPADSNIESNK